MSHKHYLALALVWLAFATGYAQTLLTDWVNLNSKNTISCITHDADYLYASTTGGGIVQINKHTGQQHSIDHAQEGLPDNYVMFVTLHDNELWTANRFYGISQKTHNGWTDHLSATAGFRTDQWFQSIAFDGNTIWAGGLLALYEMRNGQVVNTYEVNPLSNHCVVTDIVIDHNHQLWFTAYDYRRKYALCTLDKSTGMAVNKCGDYGDAYALAVDTDNSLWVATEQGLLHYTDQSQTIYNSTNTSLREDKVSDVQIDGQGNIWFVTDHHLCRYDRSTFTTYALPYTDDFLHCLDIDGTNIYIGAYQHGLLTLVNNTLTPIAYTIPSAPTSSMRGGCVDGQGRFWAGTMTGAFAYNPTDGTTEVLPMRQIDEIVSDKQGNIWLKPFNTGDTCLIRITPSDTTAYLYKQYPFTDNYICQMRFDHRNRLWLATTHGLICHDGEQWIAYTTTNTNLPTNYIYSIDFDSKDNVWCGTFGAGLLRFDGTRFTTQSTASKFIAAVCVDKNDAVWFNGRNSLYPEIYGLGLSVLRNGQVTTYTTDNSPLASNTIWDIQADAQCNLYLATGDDKGVTQFDGAQHWQTYNIANSGLALNEATHITLDEAHQRIWFTSYAGGGVSYARLPHASTAIATTSSDRGLTIRDNHLLLDRPTTVYVYDTTGRLVHVAHGTDIDLTALHSGIYIVQPANMTAIQATRIFIP